MEDVTEKPVINTEPSRVNSLLSKYVRLTQQIDRTGYLFCGEKIESQRHQLHEEITERLGGDRQLATRLIILECAKKKFDSLSRQIHEVLLERTGCCLPVSHGYPPMYWGSGYSLTRYPDLEHTVIVNLISHDWEYCMLQKETGVHGGQEILDKMTVIARKEEVSGVQINRYACNMHTTFHTLDIAFADDERSVLVGIEYLEKVMDRARKQGLARFFEVQPKDREDWRRTKVVSASPR